MSSYSVEFHFAKFGHGKLRLRGLSWAIRLEYFDPPSQFSYHHIGATDEKD